MFTLDAYFISNLDLIDNFWMKQTLATKCCKARELPASVDNFADPSKIEPKALVARFLQGGVNLMSATAVLSVIIYSRLVLRHVADTK